MHPRARPALVLAALALLAAPARAVVTMDWVLVNQPGNPPDTATNCSAASCGSVPYAYRISRYEVTNAQYAEFLNAVAASDPLELYHPAMDSDPVAGGITRNGEPGSYTYEVKPGFAEKPVVYVSFYDALRFANWLHNGQGDADTESGAYTLLGGTPTPSNGATVARDPGAIVFLPSENEWYKAAYHAGGGLYYDYPTGTNVAPGCVAPSLDTGNAANCWPASSESPGPTDVGAYALSDSPSGTFDQGGNAWEWNEQIVSAPLRGVRGGGWNTPGFLTSWYWALGVPSEGNDHLGFRVASVHECADGADDDGDGLVDGDDPGCSAAWSAIERPQCQDGLDNDQAAGIDFDGGASLDLDEDGFVDAVFNPATPAVGAPDPQCVGKPYHLREAPSCGIGAELALLLPALRRLRRRAARA